MFKIKWIKFIVYWKNSTSAYNIDLALRITELTMELERKTVYSTDTQRFGWSSIKKKWSLSFQITNLEWNTYLNLWNFFPPSNFSVLERPKTSTTMRCSNQEDINHYQRQSVDKKSEIIFLQGYIYIGYWIV